MKFKAAGRVIWLSKASVQAIMLAPMILQYLWLNKARKPSGPGDLKGDILEIALVTSSSVKGLEME